MSKIINCVIFLFLTLGISDRSFSQIQLKENKELNQKTKWLEKQLMKSKVIAVSNKNIISIIKVSKVKLNGCDFLIEKTTSYENITPTSLTKSLPNIEAQIDSMKNVNSQIDDRKNQEINNISFTSEIIKFDMKEIDMSKIKFGKDRDEKYSNLSIETFNEDKEIYYEYNSSNYKSIRYFSTANLSIRNDIAPNTAKTFKEIIGICQKK